MNTFLTSIVAAEAAEPVPCGQSSVHPVPDRRDAGLIVPGTLGAGGAPFASTHWSVVLLATRDGVDEQAREALTALCQTYWPPLYTFLRRRGHSSSDAQDLVQGFFAHLFEYDTLRRADRSKGRLRTFLLGALQHFLANERARARTSKRGGGQPMVSLDDDLAKVEASLDPSEADQPDTFYDREWAATVVDRAWENLRADYTREGRDRWLDEIKPLLFGEDGGAASQEAAAARLGQSVSTLRVALFRLRQRYRQCLREEIIRTVSDSADIDEEMSYLLRVLIS